MSASTPAFHLADSPALERGERERAGHEPFASTPACAHDHCSAWVAESSSQPLVQRRVSLAELEPESVEIEVSHCGLCHSDIHLLDDAWANSPFPFVPGHEIVGRIRALGSALAQAGSTFEVGMRVGVGWQRGACGRCRECARGEQNLCAQLKATCVDGVGGFASTVRIDHRFVIPIPDGLTSQAAAPLLCGGATVFAPLEKFVAQGAQRIAVLGIGGLGHLAICFARALGCEVVAISSSAAKGPSCLALGCAEFVAREDEVGLKRLRGSFDAVLLTSASATDARLELSLLRRGGSICVLGAAAGRLEIPAGLLVARQQTLGGSFIAPPATIARTLAFAAAHGVSPIIELLPMSAVNEAIASTRNHRPCARFVLVHPSRDGGGLRSLE